jgi:hypothetical protein
VAILLVTIGYFFIKVIVAINGYFINGYFTNNYWYLLMVILLAAISGYFINGYWWLL